MIVLCGEVLSQLGHRHGRDSTLSARNVRHRQAPTIPVTLDHVPDLEVGQVVALHHHAGSLWATAEAHDCDRLLDYPRQLYFSIEGSSAFDGTDILVSALGVTAEPRHVALGPLRLYPGTAHEAIRRTNWGRDDRHCRRLLEQAVEQRHQRRDGAITISYPPIAPELRDVPPLLDRHDLGRGNGHGPVRWWPAHQGSVLNVR